MDRQQVRKQIGDRIVDRVFQGLECDIFNLTQNQSISRVSEWLQDTFRMEEGARSSAELVRDTVANQAEEDCDV